MELAQKLRLDLNSIGPILNSRKTTRTPGAMINVMVTDDMVASFKSESSYKVKYKCVLDKKRHAKYLERRVQIKATS